MIAAMSSPSRLAATANARTAGTSHTCEVCGRSNGLVESWPQGHQAHEECVPGHWKKDRKDLENFMASLHRVHYDLADSGMVEAECLKCDWWMSDWPNGVADIYRKAREHVRGEA